MVIETQCPKCRKRYRVKDSLAGRKIKCKQCEATIKVADPFAAQDDEWGDLGDLGDDVYGSEESYNQPQLPAKKKQTKKTKAVAKSSKPAWKFPVGILGIIGGLGLLVFSIFSIVEGRRKAFRALGGSIVLIGVCFNLAFGSEE